MGVSEDLKEAARIDGCDEKKTMRYITLPLMAGTFTICFFLAISRAFVTYDVNISLTQGGPFNSTRLAAMYVYNMAFSAKEYGLGQAEALIFIPGNCRNFNFSGSNRVNVRRWKAIMDLNQRGYVHKKPD